MFTLLALTQEFCRRRGLSVPSTVIANTDDTVQRIRGLINEGNSELCDRHDFAALRRRITFDLTFASDEYLSLNNESSPGCAVKFFLGETLWNTDLDLQVPGPATPGQWAEHEVRNTWPSPGLYMVRGKGLWIGTQHTGAQSYRLDVALLFGVQATAGGAYKEYATVDTDEFLLPSRVLLGDLRWRWNKEMGLPYAEEQRSAEMMLRDLVAREGNAPVIRMDGTGDLMRDAYTRPRIGIPPGSWSL